MIVVDENIRKSSLSPATKINLEHRLDLLELGELDELAELAVVFTCRETPHARSQVSLCHTIECS